MSWLLLFDPYIGLGNGAGDLACVVAAWAPLRFTELRTFGRALSHDASVPTASDTSCYIC
jgi:hypothetical protein